MELEVDLKCDGDVKATPHVSTATSWLGLSATPSTQLQVPKRVTKNLPTILIATHHLLDIVYCG